MTCRNIKGDRYTYQKKTNEQISRDLQIDQKRLNVSNETHKRIKIDWTNQKRPVNTSKETAKISKDIYTNIKRDLYSHHKRLQNLYMYQKRLISCACPRESHGHMRHVTYAAYKSVYVYQKRLTYIYQKRLISDSRGHAHLTSLYTHIKRDSHTNIKRDLYAVLVNSMYT